MRKREDGHREGLARGEACAFLRGGMLDGSTVEEDVALLEDGAGAAP